MKRIPINKEGEHLLQQKIKSVCSRRHLTKQKKEVRLKHEFGYAVEKGTFFRLRTQCARIPRCGSTSGTQTLHAGSQNPSAKVVLSSLCLHLFHSSCTKPFQVALTSLEPFDLAESHVSTNRSTVTPSSLSSLSCR